MPKAKKPTEDTTIMWTKRHAIAAPADASKLCHFLRLPAEIRVMIYHYCLDLGKRVVILPPSEMISTFKNHIKNCKLSHRRLPNRATRDGTLATCGPFAGAKHHTYLSCPHHGRNRLKAPQSALALLEVCKIIFVEAMPIFYSINKLVIFGESSITSTKHATELLKQFPDRSAHIRDLRINLDMRPRSHNLAYLLCTVCPNLQTLRLEIPHHMSVRSRAQEREIYYKEVDLLCACFGKVRGLRDLQLHVIGWYYKPIQMSERLKDDKLKMEMIGPKLDRYCLDAFFQNASSQFDLLASQANSIREALRRSRAQTRRSYRERQNTLSNNSLS